MFPAQRGLYGHRSTMNQFAKPGFPLINCDPFPFTNANFTGIPSVGDKSPLMQHFAPDNDLFDTDLTKEGPKNSLNIQKPLSKAERRAEHNAIERARRESLNTKFQTLAQALPNLVNYRRPSKSQIVEKALDWVKQGISREERYRYQVLQLQRENKNLLARLMHQENPTTSTSAFVPSLTGQQSVPMPSVSLENTPTNANTPNIYTDLSTNNGWSIDNSNQYAASTLQMTPCSSTEDVLKQDFISKNDDEDNASSGNEDDIENQSSPCYSSCWHGSPQTQYEANHQQTLHAMMAADLYSLGCQSDGTHFDTHTMNTWNASKFPPSSLMINSVNVGHGLGSRSASVQLLS
ncbi:hypothetical protein BD408DRAFT_429267 [Parasitella parasitica]|nr:hypothetical protein BD408DRAFT_429267 [Parasitella parasitica]